MWMVTRAVRGDWIGRRNGGLGGTGQEARKEWNAAMRTESNYIQSEQIHKRMGALGG